MLQACSPVRRRSSHPRTLHVSKLFTAICAKRPNATTVVPPEEDCRAQGHFQVLPTIRRFDG